MMRPRTGLWGALREHWNRFLLHDLLPAGVVSGPANLWPREWQRAWQVASAGDVERMDELAAQFRAFSASYRFPSGKRSLAALKRGLLRRGVLSSDAVAHGTAALSADEAARFDESLEKLRAGMASALPARWRSDPACAEEP
jgi:dihydrodipicolinate synthase/N-acetylneuraminate lyase